MKEIQPFDYQQLNPELAIEIQERAQHIRQRLRHSAEDIVSVGHDLILIKSQLLHGQFQPWLNQEFEMSLSTAQRFMRVAKFLKDKNVTVTFLSPKALYELSAPSIDEKIRSEILKRLDQGENISAKEIQALKEKQDPLEDMGQFLRAQGELQELTEALARAAGQNPERVSRLQKKKEALENMVHSYQRQTSKTKRGLGQIQSLQYEVNQMHGALLKESWRTQLHKHETREALEELNQSCQTLIQQIVDLLNDQHYQSGV